MSSSFIVHRSEFIVRKHEAHHRGQIYIYLGILGVPTPPLYGLTEEEVRERSLAGPE